MEISRNYAKKLIRAGLAREVGLVHNVTENEFVAIDRLDLCRTDHYRPSASDVERLEKEAI